jgi:hypothetical protein
MANKSEKLGYKHPPKAHQWKKGQSGNPSGKKKGAKPAKSAQYYLARHLAEEVSTTTNGKHTKMPLIEALILKFLLEAMAAPVLQKVKALSFLQELGVLSASAAEFIELEDYEDTMTEEDKLLLKIARAECESDDEWQSGMPK